MRLKTAFVVAWCYFRIQLKQHELMNPLSILSSMVGTSISIVVGFLFIRYCLAGYFDGLIESLGYGNVMGFVVTGSILVILHQGLLNTVAFSLEEERRLGTLELLLLGGKLFPIFAGKLIFGLVRYGITLFAIMAAVVALFGHMLELHVNLFTLTVSIALLVGATFFQGIVAQGFILQSRKIIPLYTVTLVPLSWFTGATVPLEIFPLWMRSLAYLSPLTPALTAVRRSLFSNGVNVETAVLALSIQLLTYLAIAALLSPVLMKRALRTGEVGRRG